MIVLHETGLLDRVECVRSAVAMAAVPNPDVLSDNPLGKIPTLVLDDGRALFDSRVICEYLDAISPGVRLIPFDLDGRIECLRWQAFGDGLTDILLLWRIEMARGANASAVISAAFDTKVRAALARLEKEAPALAARDFGLGHVALACALGQLNFRFAGCGWEAKHPQLAAWNTALQSRPSIAATAVKDDGAMPMGDIVMPLRFEAA
jgi:glutathione S-transferase